MRMKQFNVMRSTVIFNWTDIDFCVENRYRCVWMMNVKHSDDDIGYFGMKAAEAKKNVDCWMT